VIALIAAHPYPKRSRAHRALMEAIRDKEGLEVRSLYDRYPDFDIDVAAEQTALSAASLVVWMHPLYWYGTPALLKHWFDRVLINGWAHGKGGTALQGKDCLWVVTTGGDEHAYTAEGRHHRPFADFIPAIEQTARYCGLNWREPFVVHGANGLTDLQLREAGAHLRERLDDKATRDDA
jgi:glutathione-regulated potassium-efflux system ancillary protein KefF